jgi:hypothetical protein
VAGVVILLVIIGIIAVVLLNRGGADFAGDWTTDFGSGPTCAMHLDRNGSNITGTYCNGTISGTVSNASGSTILNGNWQAFGTTGTLRFYIADSANKQFTGNWNGTNPWCGARSGQAQPTPCFRP